MPITFPAGAFAGAIAGSVGQAALPSNFDTVAPDTVSQEQYDAPYLSYIIQTFYLWDSGYLQLPVAEDGSLEDRPESQIVQTHAPCGKKIVVISARRLGAMPVLPDPTPVSLNETLASSIISPSSPGITPDLRGRVYSITAIYTYFLIQPVWIPEDGIYFPATPADDNSPEDYDYGPEDFSQDLRLADGFTQEAVSADLPGAVLDEPGFITPK